MWNRNSSCFTMVSKEATACGGRERESSCVPPSLRTPLLNDLPLDLAWPLGHHDSWTHLLCTPDEIPDLLPARVTPKASCYNQSFAFGSATARNCLEILHHPAIGCPPMYPELLPRYLNGASVTPLAQGCHSGSSTVVLG